MCRAPPRALLQLRPCKCKCNRARRIAQQRNCNFANAPPPPLPSPQLPGPCRPVQPTREPLLLRCLFDACTAAHDIKASRCSH